MRKLYASLLAAFAMLGGFEASAFTVTLEVDNPDAVAVTFENNPVSFTDNAATLTYDTYGYVNIEAVSPYMLVTLRNVTQGYDENMPSISSGYLSLSESQNGNVYKLTTGNLEELSTASLTINIDKTDAVRYQLAWSGQIAVLDQTSQVVKFVPDKETALYISTLSGKDLYEITCNGTPVTGSYGYYTISNIKDGDVIDIKVDYPDDLKYSVKFNLSDGAKNGFITSVTADNEPVENWEDAQVKAGSYMSVSFNTQEYKVTKFDVNGNSIIQYGYIYSPYTFNLTSNYTFDIVADKFAEAKMTVKVNNADYVLLYKGNDSSDPANVISLVNGTNEITVAENLGTINVKATSGNQITSVTQDGSPISINYRNEYSISVKDGSVIEIEAEEIKYDNVMIFYFDSPAKANDPAYNLFGYGLYLSPSYRSINDLVDGYNEIKFNNSETELSFSIYNGYTTNCFLYVNGEVPTYKSDNLSYTFTPKTNDVMKCFVGKEPEKYSLTFTVDSDLASPEVVVDMVTKLDNLDETTVLQGTKVSITPSEGDEINNVSVNGTDILPADGKYEFFVNNNSDVVIASSTSGIAGIEAEAGETVIYNLQGIRVNKKNLPSGIYIINGQKTLVK